MEGLAKSELGGSFHAYGTRVLHSTNISSLLNGFCCCCWWQCLQSCFSEMELYQRAAQTSVKNWNYVSSRP